MRIIKPATVEAWMRQFATAAPGLRWWLEVIRAAQWRSFAELRRVFPSADLVKVNSGRTVIVFNVAGKKYRLIAAVHFERQRLFAMRFLTHADYSKDRWKHEL
jgi:mRNA interferase HigB